MNCIFALTISECNLSCWAECAPCSPALYQVCSFQCALCESHQEQCTVQCSTAVGAALFILHCEQCTVHSKPWTVSSAECVPYFWAVYGALFTVSSARCILDLALCTVNATLELSTVLLTAPPLFCTHLPLLWWNLVRTAPHIEMCCGAGSAVQCTMLWCRSCCTLLYCLWNIDDQKNVETGSIPTTELQ